MMLGIFKLGKFFFLLLLLAALGGGILATLLPPGQALALLMLYGLALTLAWLYAPALLMGQIAGKMASPSSHLEDFLTLEALAQQAQIQPPRLFIYHPQRGPLAPLNGYLIQTLGPAALALSSECFSALSPQERSLLYRYHMLRLRFPWQVRIEAGISIWILFNLSLIDLFFFPINLVAKQLFPWQTNPLQQTLKLLALPLLNQGKNFVLGSEKHGYLKPALTQNIDREDFSALYFKIRQSLFEQGMEYDFLSCNGFMGFENDILTTLTERQSFDNYLY